MHYFKLEKYQHIPTTYKGIYRSMVKIALPVSLQMMLVAGLQLVDNFFIGHLKSAEQVASGVNAINNITFIISSLVAGFIGGIGVYMIHSTAVANQKLNHEIFRIKLAWMLIWSCFLIIPTLVLIRPLASLWVPSNSGAALDFAYQYGLIVLPSLLLSFVIIVFTNTLKEGQIVRITVYISVFAVLVNSVLNYVLMYLVKLGIKGAAIATMVARMVEIMIWMMYFQIKKPALIPRVRSWLNIPLKKLWAVFPKCFLWMANQFLFSLSFTLQILILSRISIAAGASLNSAGAILQLFRAFVIGYAQAIAIMVVYFIGLNKKNNRQLAPELKQYLNRLALISFSLGALIGVVCSVLSPVIFVIFPKYGYETNVNSVIMIVTASLMMAFNLLCDVPIAALKGMGVSKKLIAFDALFAWVITLPVVIILTYVNGGLLAYGWIYCLASLTNVCKPLLLFKAMQSALKTNKELSMKGLYEK